MEKTNKNFLILGHTGVGKSSFINFLVDKEVCQTSTGKPCTPENKWQQVVIPSPFAENETLTIFDSWGLEANKSAKWKKMVLEKLQDNWNEQVICGVVYCFSYFHKIEDFELDLIKDVLNTGYNVLVVLTHADCNDHDSRMKAYHDRLNTHLKAFTGKYKTVEVCNENVKKLVGESKKFGREETLEKLSEFSTENLYRLYCAALDRIEASFLRRIDQRIGEADIAQDYPHIKKTIITLIADIPFLGWLNNNKQYEETQKRLKQDINQLSEEFSRRLRQFSDKYLQVYGVYLPTQKLSFWEKCKLFFTGNCDDLWENYKKALRKMKNAVQSDIRELKKHKAKVNFK